jgi:hypothetical protein
MSFQGAEDRKVQRTFQGLLPPMFDSVSATYPDSLTEIYVYTMKSPIGPDTVTGVIEVKYLAADKAQLEYAKRTL